MPAESGNDASDWRRGQLVTWGPLLSSAVKGSYEKGLTCSANGSPTARSNVTAATSMVDASGLVIRLAPTSTWCAGRGMMIGRVGSLLPGLAPGEPVDTQAGIEQEHRSLAPYPVRPVA